jgi:ectoine hydroxylase-related dioxygenase (phytanoyl-CoA dioxygenase family)
VVDRFRRDGHCVVRGLAPRSEVEGIRPAIEQAAARRTARVAPLDQRDTYGKAFLQAANVWRLDDAVRAFVFDARFARVAAELMGVEGVRLYHDQALIKEPGGGPTPWHQDQRYWPLDTNHTITMWMPLADVDPVVGSMTFASGSHLLGDFGVPGISDESEAKIAAIVRERGLPEDSHGALGAGDATFHAGWTLHRAGANPTGAARPVITVIYFADGARVSEPADDYQRFDLAMWLKRSAPGEPARGELNPRLW